MPAFPPTHRRKHRLRVQDEGARIVDNVADHSFNLFLSTSTHARAVVQLLDCCPESTVLRQIIEHGRIRFAEL